MTGRKKNVMKREYSTSRSYDLLESAVRVSVDNRALALVQPQILVGNETREHEDVRSLLSTALGRPLRHSPKITTINAKA